MRRHLLNALRLILAVPLLGIFITALVVVYLGGLLLGFTWGALDWLTPIPSQEPPPERPMADVQWAMPIEMTSTQHQEEEHEVESEPTVSREHLLEHNWL